MLFLQKNNYKQKILISNPENDINISFKKNEYTLYTSIQYYWWSRNELA